MTAIFRRWRVRFLIKVLKFRLSLLKEQLSINGAKNTIIFALLVAIILVGGKAIVCCGNYDTNAIWFSMLCCLICCEFIFPKNVDKNCHTVSLLFGKVNSSVYRYYLYYRGFWYFQILFFYLLLPLKIEGFCTFVIASLIFETYILIITFLHRYTSSQAFSTFKWVSPFLLGFFFFANNRFNILKTDAFSNDFKICFLMLIISLLEMMIALKTLNVDSTLKSARVASRGFRRAVFLKNKDVLYVLRTDALIDPIVVVLFSGVLSYTLNEEFGDMFFTNMISFSYVFTEVYIKLLKYENKKHTLFYTGESSRKLKKEKIRNTLCIVVPLSAVVAIPLSFVTSPTSVIVAFGISLLLFLINSVFFKIALEKGRGYHTVISSREELQFIVISSIEVVAICVLQTFMIGI